MTNVIDLIRRDVESVYTELADHPDLQQDCVDFNGEIGTDRESQQPTDDLLELAFRRTLDATVAIRKLAEEDRREYTYEAYENVLGEALYLQRARRERDDDARVRD